LRKVRGSGSVLLSLLVLALSTEFSESLVKDPAFLDTHVASVQLADEASGKAFVLRFGGQEFEPDLGLPVFRYVNASRSEVLDLVMHPGGSRYEIMQFRIRRARPAEPKATAAAGLASFRTGRGVYLGLTVAEVIQVLGNPHQQSGRGDDRVLVYRCDSAATCPVLKQVNMPAYEATYTFRRGALDAVECGYPYP
jgi:hypothetical protein